VASPPEAHRTPLVLAVAQSRRKFVDKAVEPALTRLTLPYSWYIWAAVNAAGAGPVEAGWAAVGAAAAGAGAPAGTRM
jgi:hypothetical protein